MVRIIKKKDCAYFCLKGVPFIWKDGILSKLEPTDPYHNILINYDSLKDEITETDEEIAVGNVVYDKTLDAVVEGEEELTEEGEDAITFMLESEEVEGEEDSLELDGKSIKADGEEAVVEDTELSEADKAEADLIQNKLIDINENIAKLEDADLNSDIDLQEIYLQEMGKKAILQERLRDLGYENDDKKDSVFQKILESASYLKYKKEPEYRNSISKHKMGALVETEVVKRSKIRLLEHIKKTGQMRLKEDGIQIDYHPDDTNFVFSGKLEKYTSEQVLVVPEEEFFDVFDEIIKDIKAVSMKSDPVENLTVKRVDPNKVIEQLVEEDEVAPVELHDGDYYETTTDIYISIDGSLTDTLDADSSLYCRKGYVVQYDKATDSLLDETGNELPLPPQWLSPVKPVKSSDLVEEDEYVVVDDMGETATVLYEGIDGNDHVFTTRLKESLYIPKTHLKQRIRFKS